MRDVEKGAGYGMAEKQMRYNTATGKALQEQAADFQRNGAGKERYGMV